MNKEVIKFLTESNLIEGVGQEGLENSIKAYNYLMQIKAPLQKKHILKTHKLLMKDLYPEIAGKIRTVQVGIYSGGICIKKCLAPEEINKELDRCVKAINYKGEKIHGGHSWSKSTHIMFEGIHPFQDGNGRTGRLLMAWHRKQMGLSLLIIYNNDRQEYYSWFKNN